MVFIKYHRERVEVENNCIKDPKKLEKRLEKLGWTNLKWCPGNPLREPDVRRVLIGCPPNYDGLVGDYYEEAIKTLAVSGRPFESSGEILVRDKLDRPIFYGNDGWY